MDSLCSPGVEMEETVHCFAHCQNYLLRKITISIDSIVETTESYVVQAVLCVTVLFHHLVCVRVLILVVLMLLRYVTTTQSLSCSQTKVYPIHFIYNSSFIHFNDHSPSLSYLPYLVILMLNCNSALLSQ